MVNTLSDVVVKKMWLKFAIDRATEALEEVDEKTSSKYKTDEE
jgi:hypothetical protein